MSLTDKAFQFRSNEIGGSEVSTILNQNPWKSPATLLVEKRTGKRKPIPPERMRVMEVGSTLEDTVIEFYRELYPSRKIVSREREPEYTITYKGERLMTVHPDASFVEMQPDGSALYRVVEIKTTMGMRKDMTPDKCPDEYRIQTQMEMHASQLAGKPAYTTDLVCYNQHTGQLFVHEIEYDKAWCEQAVEYVGEWKRRYLDSDRPTIDLVREIATERDEVAALMDITPTSGRKDIGNDPDELAVAIGLLEQHMDARKHVKAANIDAAVGRDWVIEKAEGKPSLWMFGQRVATVRELEGRVAGGSQITAYHHKMVDRPAAQSIADEMAELLPVTPDELMEHLWPALIRTADAVVQDVREESRGKPSTRVTVQGFVAESQ